MELLQVTNILHLKILYRDHTVVILKHILGIKLRNVQCATKNTPNKV